MSIFTIVLIGGCSCVFGMLVGWCARSSEIKQYLILIDRVFNAGKKDSTK